jgi:bifunctional DNase/RNase
MDTTALIDVDVAFVGRLAFSTDCVVMLQEQAGPRRLALEGVDAATGEAVERLLQGQQPLAPTTHDLLPRLVTALGGRVEQVTIRRLVGEALYADITLDHGRRRSEVEARPGDAVALALLAGAPIRVAAAVMDVAGFDPNDRQQERIREEQELERLRRRLAERAGPPPPSPIAPRHCWTHRCGNRWRIAWSGCVPSCPGGWRCSPTTAAPWSPGPVRAIRRPWRVTARRAPTATPI